jgi:hypothetical protein
MSSTARGAAGLEAESGGPVGLAAGDGKAATGSASTAVVAGSSAAGLVAVVAATALAAYLLRKRAAVGKMAGGDGTGTKGGAGEALFSVDNPMPKARVRGTEHIPRAEAPAMEAPQLEAPTRLPEQERALTVSNPMAVTRGLDSLPGATMEGVAGTTVEAASVAAEDTFSVTNPMMVRAAVAGHGAVAGLGTISGRGTAAASYVAAKQATAAAVGAAGATFSITNPLSSWTPRVSRTTGITYYVNKETGDTSAMLPTQDAPRFIQRVSRTSGITFFVNSATGEAVTTIPINAVVGKR